MWWRILIYRIDEYANKTLSILNLGIVGLIIGLLAIDSITFKNKDSILLFLLFIFGLLLVLIIISKVIINFFWLSSSSKLPKGKKLEYRCHFIENDGGLFTEVFYELKNYSLIPQRTILYDFEGMNTEIEFKPTYIVLDRTRTQNLGKLTISGSNESVVLEPFQDYSNPAKTIYQADWSVLLDPPLETNEKVKFVRHSTEPNAYVKALQGEETEFSFRPRTPFRQLNIVIVPSTGYLLDNFKVIIDDQKGKIIRLPKYLTRKTYQLVGNTFIWKIKYPKITLRYKVVFTLKKI
jgi:hypothetical protein